MKVIYFKFQTIFNSFCRQFSPAVTAAMQVCTICIRQIIIAIRKAAYQ